MDEKDKKELTRIEFDGIVYDIIVVGQEMSPCDVCALNEFCKDSAYLGYFCNEMLGENKCFSCEL